MRARRGEAGAASVEFVALLPLLMIFSMMLLQLFFVVNTSFAADQAARDAARAYSLGRSPHDAARQSLPQGVSLIGVQTFGPDSGVRVEVEGPHFLPAVDGRVVREVVMP